MKKILLLFSLFITTISLAQNQPVLHNATFDDIPKSSGSDCTCAGWINKDIADQGEDSTTSGSSVLKFDDLESDGMYQEIAVEANSNYTVNFSYIFSDIPTTTTNLEIYILKGSGYESGYTPLYNPPLTADQNDLGYRTVADVETAGNQLATSLIVPPTHESATIATLSFDTGAETSIAIFVRAVGPTATHGDPGNDKGWMNGNSEIRIDNISLVNNGYSNNIWTGTSADWESTGNWSLETLPTEYNRIIIGNTANQPIIGATTGVKAYNLNIDSGSGGSLNITSGGSLIVEDVAYGDITYNRAVTGSASKAQAWHLVSSPFTNETIEDLRTNNAFATSDNVANRIGIADYNNTDEDWDYLLDNATGSLVNGQGYSTRLAAAGNITFIGSVGVADVPVSVTKNTNGLNLLGNPFTSYINSKTFLDDANNTTEITNKQIWIWDSSANAGAGDFIVKPSAEEFQIAPGQGFFVEAAVAGSVTFAKTNQSHQTDTFEKSNKKTEITLRLKDGTSDKFTKISFHDNSTIGFDNGYEGELFNGVSTDFNVFTQLIENNSKNYQIQSLPMVYEDLIIPIGVKSTGNKEITFSSENTNLPENLNVFIEDRAKNIFINLNENNYKVTLNEVLDGVGRFFLHTSSKAALNIDDNLVLDNISIYKANSTTLRIVGLQQGNANIKLYNVVGKQIMNTDFEANGAKEISLPNLTTGVYIVQLETEIGILNKKIILE